MGFKLVRGHRFNRVRLSVPLVVTSSFSGQHTIIAKDFGYGWGGKLYLTDKYLGTSTVLDSGVVYPFNYTKNTSSAATNRFRVSNYLPTPVITSLSDAGSQSRAIQMYPNPVNGDLTVNLLSDNEIQAIEVYSFEGVSVMKKAGLQSNKAQLSFTDLPQGVYLVKVITDSQEFRQLVTKQ